MESHNLVHNQVKSPWFSVGLTANSQRLETPRGRLAEGFKWVRGTHGRPLIGASVDIPPPYGGMGGPAPP